MKQPGAGWRSCSTVLWYIRCLSRPYPETVHWKPAGSWVWSGGRHTTRTDGDFSAQPPSPLLIFKSAAVERQAQIPMITPQLHLPTDTCGSDAHTYVIVIAEAVIMWVDDQLFYWEDLFLHCIVFTDGLLAQVYREDVGVAAEQTSRREYFRHAKRTRDTAAAAGDEVFL